MKELVKIGATIIISATVTYGLIASKDYLLGIIGICLLMMGGCVLTVPLTQAKFKNAVRDRDVFGYAFIGILLSLISILGIFDPSNGDVWITIVTTIVILLLKPNIITVYFTAALLGCTGALYVLSAGIEEVSPSIHFICVVIFTLSTWTRVYLDSRK